MGNSSVASQIDEVAIDVINIGIVILDSSGSVVQWNQWMEKYSGYDKQAVLGKRLETVFPEINNIRLFSAISQSIESGRASVLAQSIHNSPIPLYNKNNHERIAQAIEIQPLKVSGESQFHCLIQISNVDAAVSREEQLRRKVHDLSDSQNRIKAIVDISGDGVIIVNDDGLIESLNTRAEEIFLCSQEEVVGKEVLQFFPSAYAEQVPSFIKRFSSHSGLMHDGEWRMMEAKRKGGGIFPINLNLTTTKVGNKNQIVGIVRDLSELEESERALKETNDSLKMALDCGELWVWDLEVETGFVNQNRMMSMLGYKPGEYEHNVATWTMLIHPDDVSKVEHAMQEQIKGLSNSFELEYRLRKADGAWMWVHDQGRIISRDNEGKALRFLGINQNITRRKLAEIKAREASEKAIEAAQVKSEFIGNMSHELRTPMNGVMGVLNLLKHSDPTDEQDEYIDVAKRSAESLLKMIDSVLDFSKLGAKSVELEVLSFDPEDILKDVVKLLSETEKEKTVRLEFSIEDESLNEITTDPCRLRQVLLNLAGNALKFTAKGHVLVRLLRTEGSQVLFEVEDTGVGIPKDRQKAIFDAFSQADVSITRKYGGTGLGLGISKQLVELMGGHLMVESEEGKGSTFSFTIEDRASSKIEDSHLETEFA